MSYKAFISYSHAADNQLAPTLQSALQRFAKPFYRLRAINVFRDKTSLHLTPKLWPLIQQALRDSEYFILLASPDAASSQWVRAEVDEWLKLKNGSLDNFLIVLTDGEIWWDRSRSDFDWNKTTGLPLSLQGKFAVEPLFSDLRWAKKSTDLSLRHPQFLDDIGTIAATLHGKSKDVMIGKDVRQHRVFKLASGAAILVLLLSVMATSVAAYYANERRKEADQQREAAVRAANQEREARDYADQQRNIADEQRQKAVLAAENERAAKENETQQRKKAEEATKNEKVARQSAEERRVEAEHQRSLAEQQRQLAEEKTKIALSRQLAAQASNKLKDQYDLTLLLGVEASRAAPTFEVRSVLLAALESNPDLITFLDGHKSAVNGIAFSPDGKILVTGGFDNMLRLWDATTGQPIGKPMIGNTRYISSVAFSPDGKTVASGGFGTIALWDITKDEPLQHNLKMEACCEYVHNLAFSPDGKVLASSNGEVVLWDVARGTPKGEPLPTEPTVRSLAFSSDGRTLASGSSDATITLWNFETHQPRGLPLTGHGRSIESVAFSPDGKTLASGTDQGEIFLWDINARTHRPPFFENSRVRSMAFSTNGETLLVGADYGHLTRWYISSTPPFPGHFNLPKDTVGSVAVSPDGKKFASASGSGTVIFWRFFNEWRLGRELDEAFVNDLGFSPNGQTLALTTYDHSLRLLNMTADPIVGKTITGHKASTFAFSPDGSVLASADKNSIVLLSMATGKPLGILPNTKAGALAFSANGKTLASGGCGKIEQSKYRGQKVSKCVEGEILMWDVASRHQVGEPLPAGDATVRSLVFSADGSKLASVGTTFIVFDVATRQSWSENAYTVAFSPDGKTLFSGGTAGIFEWDVATHHKLRVFPRLHQYEVSNIALSPDGHMLASTSPDMFVLWDVATRQPLWSTSEKSTAAFSPDSQTLATVTAGKIKLWNLGLELWRARACSISNRNLTFEEWKQYFEDEPYRKTCESLPLNPTFRDEARRLAKEGELASALTLLRRELVLDPSLKFNPEREGRRLAAVGKGEKLLNEVDLLVAEEEIREAIASYDQAVITFAQAVAIGPTPELAAASHTFNELCWKGALMGHAREVMNACESAVTINPKHWGFRDSRGLARALTGNVKGAIEDFEVYAKGPANEAARTRRKRWITALREGKDPFTLEELDSLRDE